MGEGRFEVLQGWVLQKTEKDFCHRKELSGTEKDFNLACHDVKHMFYDIQCIRVKYILLRTIFMDIKGKRTLFVPEMSFQEDKINFKELRSREVQCQI